VRNKWPGFINALISPPFFLVGRGVGYFQYLAGCSKRPSSKVAASEEGRRYRPHFV
jgi:hypothetical protein